MTITHAISTERLVNVLQRIALQQQTGCLSVEQIHSREEGKGDIFFERGDTVFALTAQESGETALHTMLRWTHVSSTFQEGTRYTMPRAAERAGNRHIPSSLDMRRLSSIKAQESRQTPSLGIPVIPRLPQASQPQQSPQVSQIHQLPPPLAIDMMETQLLPPRNGTDALSPVTPLVRPINVALYDTGEHQGELQGKYQQAARHIDRMVSCEEMGVGSIFRSLPVAGYATTLNRLDRRDRVVLLLLNGKRTIHDVALLVRRSELETARAVVRLLKQGYVEYIGEE